MRRATASSSSAEPAASTTRRRCSGTCATAVKEMAARPHRACSAARARPGEPAADLRLRRRARRHRARRPPARVQPDVRRVRPAGALVARRSTREKLEIGGGKERMASLLTPEFVARGRAARRTPRASASCWPSGTRARPRSTRRWSPRARCPAGPGSPRDHRARRSTPAGRWRWPRPRPRRPCGRCWSTSSGPERAARLPGARRRHRAAQEAGAGHLPARARAARRRPAEALVVEDSRNGLLAAAAAGLRCVVTVNGYTGDEDFARGGARRGSASATRRRADARARQPQRGRARRPASPWPTCKRLPRARPHEETR